MGPAAGDRIRVVDTVATSTWHELEPHLLARSTSGCDHADRIHRQNGDGYPALRQDVLVDEHPTTENGR